MGERGTIASAGVRLRIASIAALAILLAIAVGVVYLVAR